ncbi:MAG: VWA domain-containing protein [Vicinamibacterales bacterium]|nr:VWA domain-containing protein [Vicinamibacterales bacterium]
MTRAPRRQNRGVWWLALMVVCAAVATITLPAQTGRTQERDLFVSVLDSAGNPVTDLAAGDFIVREDRLVREVLRARRATDPIDLAILVDNSQASTNNIQDLRRALEAFVTKMADAGNLSLTTVADRPTRVQDYTRDTQALQKAVGRLFPVAGSGATMLEAISEVLTGLKTRQTERAAVLAIWLGGPEFSGLAHLRVLEHLQAEGAALHVVTVGSGVPPDTATEEGRHREIVFDQGSRDTGGRRKNVLSSMGLGEALDQLAAELTSQYRITYARPDSLIPASKLEVSVRPAGLSARGTRVRAPKKGPALP